MVRCIKSLPLPNKITFQGCCSNATSLESKESCIHLWESSKSGLKGYYYYCFGDGRRKSFHHLLWGPHLMILQAHRAMKYNKLYNAATEEEMEGGPLPHLALSELTKYQDNSLPILMRVGGRASHHQMETWRSCWCSWCFLTSFRATRSCRDDC